MIITGGCLSDCKEALKLAKSDGEKPSTCTSHHFKGEEVIELIKELDMSKDYPSSTNFKLIMSYYFIFKVTSLLKKEITHVHFTGCHRESIHYSLCIHKYMHNKHYVVHLKREVVRSH